MAARMTIRTPMPIRMRAKQFAMFDALKGLSEAIAAKEQQVCHKRDLADNRIDEINRQLRKLHIGDYVTITFYCSDDKQYREVVGYVAKIDSVNKEIQIGKSVISFSDIWRLLTFSTDMSDLCQEW